MSPFVYVVRPAFDGAFMARATEAERGVVDAHGDYLERLAGAGKVSFAGRCMDGPFGLVVLDVESEPEARDIVAQDPSVRAGVQTAELHPFSVLLPR
ncbi:MAG: hypothetical protein H0U90_02355 [Actinobacteria bacterium]|nr:hypothetical protein [Actinomycetota bacterium]